MKKNVKTTIGDAETVQKIEEYMQKIRDRYGCYVEFKYSYSLPANSDETPYEKWTFSTPFTTANKAFETGRELLALMRRIEEDPCRWVLKHYKKILAEEKRRLEEDKKSAERALKAVEETLARLNER